MDRHNASPSARITQPALEHKIADTTSVNHVWHNDLTSPVGKIVGERRFDVFKRQKYYLNLLPIWRSIVLSALSRSTIVNVSGDIRA